MLRAWNDLKEINFFWPSYKSWLKNKSVDCNYLKLKKLSISRWLWSPTLKIMKKFVLILSLNNKEISLKESPCNK